MLNSVFKLIVLFIVTLLMSLLAGRGCVIVSVHPSNNATYVTKEVCIVRNDVSHEQYQKLLYWCEELHTQEK